MTMFVGGFQVRQIEMPVECGGFEFDVTEHELNVADVATIREQAGGKRVATARAAGMGALNEVMDMGGEAGRVNPLAVDAEKERGCLAGSGEPRAAGLEIMFEPDEGALSDGHIAVFTALALAHANETASEIHVRKVEVAKFVTADASGVGDFEDGAVTQPESCRSIGHGNYAFDFRYRQNASGQPVFGARHFEVCGGIVQQGAVPHQPAKEAGDGGQPLALGAGRQRVSVALAVLVEVELITMDCLATDATGRSEVKPLTELLEMAQLFGLPGYGLRAIIDGCQVLQVADDARL